MTDRQERTRRANTTLGRILRYIGLIIGIIAGWNIGLTIEPSDATVDGSAYAIVMAAAIGALCFMLAPYITISLFIWLGQEVRKLEMQDILASMIGLLTGGLISSLIALPVSMLPDPFGQYLPFLFAVGICSVAVMACVLKKRELYGFFVRRGGNGVETTSDSERGAEPQREVRIILDTSAVIDGRIVDLVEGSFMRDDLVVTTFVLRELQSIADSSDSNRRSRGRRGLETLERLRELLGDRMHVEEIPVTGDAEVDDKLVRIAKDHGYLILTGDQQLAHIATLHGVTVLNLQRLAEAVRPVVSAGEEFSVAVVQPGREYGQGVGFLDDGTMVVVEAGHELIGEEATVVVTRTLRTSAGRMVFAYPKEPVGEQAS